MFSLKSVAAGATALNCSLAAKPSFWTIGRLDD